MTQQNQPTLLEQAERELLEEKEQHEVDVGELLVVSNDRRMLRAANATLRQRIAELRKRMVTDQFINVGAKKYHVWTCAVCMHRWYEGEVESHDSGCPCDKQALSPEPSVERKEE